MSSKVLEGQLHSYGKKRYPVFISGAVSSLKCIVVLFGLTDGMNSASYSAKLSRRCEEIGWACVQPHLSSAYHGFANGSLEKDVEEIEEVVLYLRSIGKTSVVLLGHSTGCNDIMQYLAISKRSPVDKAILLAPVSDRHCLNEPKLAAEAERMVKDGRGKDWVPESVTVQFGLEITAYRAWSLLCLGGDDDFFSRDIPATRPAEGTVHRPLSETFGVLPVSTPLLVICGSSDECCPQAAEIQPELMRRWREAVPEGLVFQTEMIQGATHEMKDQEEQTTRFLDLVTSFVGRD